MERFLVGSRAYGLEDENSDYDYCVFDVSGETYGTYTKLINERIDEHSHCYHYSREYRDKVARFEIDDPNDFQWIFNARDFNNGIISYNPFDYRDKWVEKLKNIDFHHKHFFATHARIFSKRFYHLVYNLECLKQNTLTPTMERVKKFHDMQAKQQEEYLEVIEEIKNL